MSERSTESLTRVAVYRRPVRASLERVWENVHDWEHLPSLHRESFSSIEKLDAGPWGWRARVGLPGSGGGHEGATLTIELCTEEPKLRYVTRTLEGPGSGTEIWTHLDPVRKEQTDIRVEFLVPDVAPESADGIGKGFSRLYARLWDQDEQMMQRREAMLALLAHPPEPDPAPLELGHVDDLRGRLPLRVDFGGRPFRVIDLDGDLVVHSAICPHLLGPLDRAPLENGWLVCPWHGYAFHPISGRCEGRSLRLDPAPRLEIAPGTGIVRLLSR